VEPVFQLSTGWLAASILAILFEILFPLAVAFFVRRRYGLAWRYFLYGALIFFLFQLITRVPAVQVIQGLIGPQLQASRTFLFAWLVVLSLTAGLFEEVGRYVGYRWLMGREDKTWSKAVMYGLGHGGLESILLVGGLSLLTLVNLVALSTMPLQSIPEQQRAAITQQLAQLSALPEWTPLVGAYERFWTLAVQVALSVLVLQVFRRGSLAWLWLAILGHAAVDLGAVGISTMLVLSGTLKILVPEAVVTISGLIGLWIIWKFRSEEAPNAVQRNLETT
jgi:uncharacterized membrane protein YhfC